MWDIFQHRVKLFRFDLVPEHVLHGLLNWVCLLLSMSSGLALGLNLPDSVPDRFRHLAFKWIAPFVMVFVHTDGSCHNMSYVVSEVGSFLFYRLALMLLWGACQSVDSA